MLPNMPKYLILLIQKLIFIFIHKKRVLSKLETSQEIIDTICTALRLCILIVFPLVQKTIAARQILRKD